MTAFSHVACASAETDGITHRVATWMLVALGVGMAASTILHHRWPGVLHVPPVDGVPHATLPALLAADLVVLGLAGLCLAHAWHHQGPFLATAFLVGSFVFTGIEESMWILLGRFGSTGTYWFTRGLCWFLETPFTACAGWFVLAYASMWVAERALPHAGPTAHAAVAGALAMDLDLWFDPVQTHALHRSWIWVDQPGGLWLFSIPITNFLGWFLLIFLFALVFERLPARVRRQGVPRATAWFFGVLFGLEVAILAFFTLYGAIEQAVLRPKLNLTLWGL